MGLQWVIYITTHEEDGLRPLVHETGVHMGCMLKRLCLLWVNMQHHMCEVMDRRPRDRPATRMISRMCSPCRTFYRNNPEAIWIPNPSNPIADDDMCHGCVTNAQVASYLQSQGFE